MIIGIDVGSTTTKAVAIDGGALLYKVKTRAADAVTSATGAFGKMIVEHGIRMGDIRKIMLTGAGAPKIKSDLFGISTGTVSEFDAIGTGGIFLSALDEVIITNIGTGTAIIDAARGRIAHLGGSGVGGGTILGLAKKLLSMSDFNSIMELAARGKLSQVDLLLEDIMGSGLGFLNPETTASNFGKMLDSARPEDIALGIVNMVYQVIGMISVFAAKSKAASRVLVVGNGSHNPIGKNVLDAITAMYHVTFEYPPDAEYTTAIGAGLKALA